MTLFHWPSNGCAFNNFYGYFGHNRFVTAERKLERNSQDELGKTLIILAMGSIARKENPRRLEMILNSTLPPQHQIRFFK